MRRLIFGDNFLNSAKRLEGKLKPKLKFCLDLLSTDSFHPLLHTKPLTGKLSGCYSFRISRDYRSIFKFLPDGAVYLIDVGNRKDIYR